MEFSPSDQRRNQCQFEAFAMKVICGERSDYFRELSAWSAKETTFSELPDVVLNNLASPDSDPSEQYVFQILGYYVPIQNDRLVESIQSCFSITHLSSKTERLHRCWACPDPRFRKNEQNS